MQGGRSGGRRTSGGPAPHVPRVERDWREMSRLVRPAGQVLVVRRAETSGARGKPTTWGGRTVHPPADPSRGQKDVPRDVPRRPASAIPRASCVHPPPDTPLQVSLPGILRDVLRRHVPHHRTRSNDTWRSIGARRRAATVDDTVAVPFPSKPRERHARAIRDGHLAQKPAHALLPPDSDRRWTSSPATPANMASPATSSKSSAQRGRRDPAVGLVDLLGQGVAGVARLGAHCGAAIDEPLAGLDHLEVGQ